MRRLMIVVPALVGLAAMSACGSPSTTGRQVASLSTTPSADATTGTGDTTGTTTPTDPADAALAFAKCMREHGIDMPDPVVQDGGAGGGGGVAIQVNGGPDGSAPFDQTAMQEANTACQPIMEKATGSFDPPSPEEQEKAKEQALAFAKCMREHGIDMPDPVFSDNGAINQTFGGPDGTGPGANMDPKELQTASEACGQAGPGGGFSVTIGSAP